MNFVIENQPLPLALDPDGAVRVGNTRVTLDSVVGAFLEGLTAEEIAQQYPSLALSDIYSVVGYYLSQHNKVDEYLRRRKVFTAKVKRQNELKFDPVGVRDRLLARKIK